MIEFSCESCGRHYQVSDDLGGRRVKCKDCQEVIAIPVPAAATATAAARASAGRAAPPPPPARSAPGGPLIDFSCESCGQRYQVKPELAGRKVKCKGCQEVMRVPDPDAPSSAIGDLYGLDDGDVPARPKSGPRDDYGLAPAPSTYNPYAAPEAEINPRRMGFGDDRARGLEPGGIFARFCASFIDSLLIGVVSTLVEFALGFTIAIATGHVVSEGAAIAISLVVRLIVFFAYIIPGYTGPNQATPGKRAMGLRVVTDRGKTISGGQAIGREFAKILSSILLIGYIMALFDPQRRTLHDRMAGTLIVKSR